MVVRRLGGSRLLGRVLDAIFLVRIRRRVTGAAILFSGVALPASHLALGWSHRAFGELRLGMASASTPAGHRVRVPSPVHHRVVDPRHLGARSEASSPSCWPVADSNRRVYLSRCYFVDICLAYNASYKATLSVSGARSTSMCSPRIARWEPAPLLERLAKDGLTFRDFDARREVALAR